MGQTIGRTSIQSEAQLFLNLPRHLVLDLWEAFNEIAEGFGLTLDEMQDILRVALQEYLGYTDKRLNALAEALFHLYDDDRNYIVDSLEFFSSFAIVSGMSTEEKISYVFDMFDLDESGRLNIDALTLALRASMSGMRKLAGLAAPPREVDIDLIANMAFERLRESLKDDVDTELTISKPQFIEYAVSNPEISSWLAHFGDFDEVEVATDQQQQQQQQQQQTFSPPLTVDLPIGRAYATMGLDATAAETKHEMMKRDGKDVGSSDLRQQPWRQMIPLSAPTDVPDTKQSAQPNASLFLEWVHGRNTKVLGMSAFYTIEDDVLYPAGAVVVKICKSESEGEVRTTQEFYMEHTDYVTCLAVHPDKSRRTLVATSQRGVTPKINVWTSKNMETLVSLTGFHRFGVSRLDFSPSGELLLSVGMDKMHSIAIYRWQERTAIFTTDCGGQIVMDARFLGSSKRFGVCGNNFVYFWDCPTNDDHPTYTLQRGLFGKEASRQTMTCLVFMNNHVITGAVTGVLCLWKGRNCSRVVQVHTSGAVTAIDTVLTDDDVSGGFVVGTSDGKIHTYSQDLELRRSFSVAPYGGLDRYVQGICWNPKHKRIMIALSSSELFEINDSNGLAIGTITGGHSGFSLLGLSVNPIDEDQVATVGSDKTLRIWNAVDHSRSRTVVLDTPALCVAYTRDGSRLIVGYGSVDGTYTRKDGVFVVLKEADLSIKYQAKDSKSALTDVKCSRDGKFFAIGCMDGCICIYHAHDYAPLAKVKGHTGPVTRIDFGHERGSTEAAFLQSNSENGEIMFWTVHGKKQTPSSQSNTLFETQSATFGWSVEGAHGPHDEGCTLQSCSRTERGDTIAIVDDAGRIRLYCYPVVADDQSHNLFRGHAALISNVQFSLNDKWLFTIGGEDACLFQWRHVHDGILLGPTVQPIANSPDLLDGDDMNRPAVWENAANCDVNHIFEYEEADEEDEGSAAPTRPWRRAIVAPSDCPKEDGSLPDSELKLEWIHGYSASKCRSNLVYGEDGCILYNVGTNLVRYKGDENLQDFFTAKDEITCIALHPLLPLCAIGQVGKRPRIEVIDYESMECVSKLSGYQQRAISTLTFDPRGKFLVSVGQDSHHTMCVHDWKNETIVALSYTGESKTLDISFRNNVIVQAGVNLLRFWTLNGCNLNFANAYLSDQGKNQAFYSIGWDGNSSVVGTDDGRLYRFLGRDLDCSIKAHDSAIYTIHSTNEGNATGSKDGTVKIWGPSLVCKLTISMERLGSLCPCIKSVFWNNELERLLIGTAGSEIWELSSSDGTNLHKSGPLEQGHFGSHTSGLSISLNGHVFASVGSDATLRVWDIYKPRAVRVCPIEMAARACAFSPDGRMIAVGFGSPKKEWAKHFHGKWIIVREHNFSILSEARDSRKMITEIKWSPDGKHIAVGSWDNKCYLYDVSLENSTNLKVKISTVIDRHNSYIAHLDFSADSKHLRVNCGAFDLNFYETATGLHLPAASKLKDVVWHSQTCTLSWPVQSVWSPYNDGKDVVSVDCTQFSDDIGSNVVASGDCLGYVHLFRYPSTVLHAQSKTYRKHCGEVAKTRWAGKGSHLVTVGSQDHAIMIWNHIVDDDAIADKVENTRGCDILNMVDGADPRYINEDETKKDFDTYGLARPWIAAVVEPSKTFNIDDNVPAEDLELCFVHGFRSKNSLVYTDYGNTIYPSAKICIVYNKEKHTQKYYRGHGEQVGALCAHGRFVASGEIALRPKLHIWDSGTCRGIAILPHFHRRGIACLAFSSDGKELVSVGADKNSSIAVWQSLTGQWHDAGLRMHYFDGGYGVVNFICFTPDLSHETFFVTGGQDRISFWSRDGSITSGIFGDAAPTAELICGMTVGKILVTGTNTGYLCAWKDRRMSRAIKAHDGRVNCLSSFEGGIVAGGDDGRVTVWSDMLEQMFFFYLEDAGTVPVDKSITSLFVANEKGKGGISKILLGTRDHSIYEVAYQSGTFSLIHENHSQDDAVGLAMHPSEASLYASCGGDGIVRIWSIDLKKVVRKAVIGHPLSALAWSNEGKELLVGCGGRPRGIKDGVHYIVDSESMKIVHEGRDTSFTITDAKYSPNSAMFALACEDHKIYIYENSKPRYRLMTIADRNNAIVTAIDFSADSSVIQSDSADYEHRCFNSDDGKVFSLPSQLKNTLWSTYTCCYGWPVQGLWSSDEVAKERTKPVCSDRSSNEKLLACGTKEGSVKLYKYPAVSKSAGYRVESGHALGVGQVRFSCDGKTLVTIGRKDNTILVWRVYV